MSIFSRGKTECFIEAAGRKRTSTDHDRRDPCSDQYRHRIRAKRAHTVHRRNWSHSRMAGQKRP